MPKIDNILRNQPKEIARQVMRTIDRREHLQKINKPVYDGDLSWKKVSDGGEYNYQAKYQPNQPTLSSLVANPSKKLNVI